METEGQAKAILQVLRSIYQRHLACDFIIVIAEAEPVEFHVHKALLAAFSGFFNKLLTSGQLNMERYVVRVVDAATMSQLIDYIYTGNLLVAPHNVWLLLGAASQLDIPPVTSICQNFLKTLTDCEVPIAEEQPSQLLHCEDVVSNGCEDVVSNGCEHVVSNLLTDYDQAIRQSLPTDNLTDSKEQFQSFNFFPETPVEPLSIIDNITQPETAASHENDNGACLKNHESKKKHEKGRLKRKRKKSITSRKKANSARNKKERMQLSEVSDDEYKQDILSDDISASQGDAQFLVSRHNRRKPIKTKAAIKTSLRSSIYKEKVTKRVAKEKVDGNCKALKHRRKTLNILKVEQLTFNDLKCGICQEVFVHYSAQILHSRMHKTQNLSWLGRLPRKYMLLYMKNFMQHSNKQTTLLDQHLAPESCTKDSHESQENVRESSCYMQTDQSVGKDTSSISALVHHSNYQVNEAYTDGSLCIKAANEQVNIISNDLDLHVDAIPELFVNQIISKPHIEKLLINFARFRYKLKQDSLKLRNMCKAFKVTCTLCNRTFPFYSIFMQHFIMKHGFRRTCNYCACSFNHPSALVLHKLKQHGFIPRLKNSKPLHCDMCGRQFLYPRTLLQHRARIHQDKLKTSLPNLKSISCRLCGAVFKYHKALLIHLPLHGLTSEEIQNELTDPGTLPLRENFRNFNPQKKKKCPVCKRLFRSMTTLRQHMHVVHNAQVTKSCIMTMKYATQSVVCQEEGCSFATKTVHDLELHMAADHTNISYECKFCHYNTRLKRRFVKHMKMNHTNAKTCEMCDKQFKRHFHLKQHRFRAHKIIDPTVKLHHCPVNGCDYTGLDSYVMDVHMRKHNKNKPFECEFCGKKLKTEKNLQKHKNKLHLGIRPYICDQCGAAYGEESELKVHMVRHEEERRFHCEHCDYTTQEKGNYQSHLWAKHKIKLHKKVTVFECTQCPYTTDRKTRFTQHMDSHNNVRKFKCPHCERTFVAKNTMQSHIKWTHMEKSLPCDFCNHKTSTLNMLREHVRMMHTHRDVKPYQCAYCDFRCRTSGNCRKHCMNRHKDKEVKWVRVCSKYPNNDRPILSAEGQIGEPGILRKDSRADRVFQYEPKREIPQFIINAEAKPLVKEPTQNVQPIIMNSAQLLVPAVVPETVNTNLPQGHHMQFIPQPQEGLHQIEQLQIQQDDAHHIQQQYHIQPMLYNQTLTPAQQHQLLLLWHQQQQQQQLKQ